MPEEGPSRQPLMLLLEEMYKLQPRIGYHFLYFLKVRSDQTSVHIFYPCCDTSLACERFGRVSVLRHQCEGACRIDDASSLPVRSDARNCKCNIVTFVVIIGLMQYYIKTIYLM